MVLGVEILFVVREFVDACAEFTDDTSCLGCVRILFVRRRRKRKAREMRKIKVGDDTVTFECGESVLKHKLFMSHTVARIEFEGALATATSR